MAQIEHHLCLNGIQCVIFKKKITDKTGSLAV